MKREYYSDSISNFLRSSTEEVLGILALNNDFSLIQTQRGAWVSEIEILREVLKPYEGSIYFEYSIPRMGRRIDVVILIGPVIFVIEFKVGEGEFTTYAIDQVFDYALDLKNFHDASHQQFIAPVISFEDSGRLLISPVAYGPALQRMGVPIGGELNVGGFTGEQKRNLEFHRGFVFLEARR